MYCDRLEHYITKSCNYSEEIRQFSHYSVTDMSGYCVPDEF